MLRFHQRHILQLEQVFEHLHRLVPWTLRDHLHRLTLWTLFDNGTDRSADTRAV